SAQTVSACRVAFKHLIGPDSPVTGGNFKTMNIVIPKRTIFSAEEPAACGWYFTSLGLLIDLIVKSLSPVLKEQSAAEHYGESMVITLAGKEEKRESSKDKSTFLYVEPTAGGLGAFSSEDEQSGLINNSNGDFKNLPIEVLKGKYPIKINSYSLRENSGGSGKKRGGLGITREYEMRDKANLSLWFERSVTPAWGLFGGQSGEPPKVTVKTDNGEEEMLKVNAKPLSSGDRVIVKTGGGGGFGNPLGRTFEQIKEDIIDGYIDIETALKEYGVTYDPTTKQVNRN